MPSDLPQDDRIVVRRPPAVAPAAGSLGLELFQNAYVVRDLDAAMEQIGASFGVRKFTMVPVPPLDGGATLRIALAWSAGQMIELIEARGPGLELHATWLPEGADIRFHHNGYFVRNEREWADLLQKLAEEGRPIVMSGDSGFIRYAYVYAAELGHYLEFVLPNADGKAFFENVAAN